MSTTATQPALAKPSTSEVQTKAIPEHVYTPPPTQISFSEIWRILRKRRRALLGTWACVFAASIAVTLFSTRQYRSTATIEVNRQNTDLLSLEDMQSSMADLKYSDYSVIQKTEIQVLQNDTLLLRVAKELKLEGRPAFSKSVLEKLPSLFKTADESRLALENAPERRARVLKILHSNLRINPIPGTRLLSVSYMDQDAATAALIVNTLIKDHKDEAFELRSSATTEETNWLSKQLQGLKDQVETAQQKLVDYQKNAGIIGTDETHNVVMSRLETLNQQLVAAESNRILAGTIYRLTQSGNPELISGLVGPSASSGTRLSVESVTNLHSLRAEQNQLKLRYAEATQTYGSAHPKVTDIKAQLAENEDAIQKETDDLATRAENDYLAAKQAEEGLRASFEQEKLEANKLNDNAVGYSILKHEVDSTRELYDSLLKKMKEAGIFAALRYSNVMVLDEARAPARPSRPIVLLNLAIGIFAGLLLGIAFAFVHENVDQTITAPDQAEAIARIPLLGTIPQWNRIPGASQSDGLGCPEAVRVVNEPATPVAESYRFLRTSLQLIERTSGARVFMFTSALPGEGKTTTSLNCAAALASQGSKVLLVEADLRRPKLHNLLRLEASSGLAWALATPGSTLSLTPCPGLPFLAILPAGTVTAEPGNLLGSRRFRDCIQSWKTQFDYIVVDTPPVLSVADAMSIAPSCDAVVLVTRFATTTRKALLRARALLDRIPGSLKGVVVNSLDSSSPEFDAYYGYKFDSARGAGYYPVTRR